MIENPFAVVSPEEMSAEKANQLFVESSSEFPQIENPGNVIITGARGCGKSMLIRCAMPDVLMLKDKTTSSKLRYLAFRIPIKRTSPNLTEIRLLDKKHAPLVINEHFLALHVVMYSLLNLTDIEYDDYSEEAYRKFFTEYYSYYMKLSGCLDEINVDYSSANSFFKSLYKHTEKLQADFVQYVTRLALNTEGVNFSYSLPLLSFMRFIFPVFKELTNLPGFPPNKDIYIFIDDADNLSKTQTEVLNSWLAFRTQPTISLKISTQLGQYKTFLSSTGVLIESPHDYQDVNISARYTTDIDKGTNYYKKASEIIKKRLLSANIDVDPEDFFPPYDTQENGIKKEAEKIKSDFQLHGRGNRVDDDARRYAIPNYIRNLGGQSKSRSTYRYAGLDNIIHLSSGIIRYLLDATAKMYDIKCNKENKNNNVKLSVSSIPTDIQNEVMRKQADHFLFTELRKFEQTFEAQMDQDNNDSVISPISSPASDTEKLQNLICAMGKTFHEILLSDRSERKVFSVALSNIPDEELKRVFRLGVQIGFFHEMRIGNKDGSGRTFLYVLNRCFAPLFTLDPTGFQGYLFMTNSDLHKAIKDGKQLRTISSSPDIEDDIKQLSFSDIWED